MALPLLSSFYHRLLFLLPFATEPFTYDNPNEWHLNHSQCRGLRQSPIAIYSNKVIPINLPPLSLGLYDILLDEKIKLHNNGLTVEFEVPETIIGNKPFITGGLLEHIFTAEGVHFHWGSNEHRGSEHVINGRQYDMEMHIVHKNAKYQSIPIARNYPDGLAVIAVLFKVVESDNVYYPGLNEIYNTVDDLKKFNTTAETADKISLGSLLGSINSENFYTYRGSLTTPPCSEAVTWIIFPEVVPISYSELPKFWRISDARGNKLINNFRPIQSLGYRKIYHRQPLRKEFY